MAFKARLIAFLIDKACVPLWHLELVPLLSPIANEIAPSGSGDDSSQDCSRVDRVLVDFDCGWVVRYLD